MRAGFSAGSVGPFVKGMGFGLTAGYYVAAGAVDLPFFIASFLPQAFFSAVVLLLAGSEAFKMSVLVFRTSFFSQPNEYTGRISRSYCVRFVIYLFLCAALCFAGTLLVLFGLLLTR
jgi:hypothetical protein